MVTMTRGKMLPTTKPTNATNSTCIYKSIPILLTSETKPILEILSMTIRLVRLRRTPTKKRRRHLLLTTTTTTTTTPPPAAAAGAAATTTTTTTVYFSVTGRCCYDYDDDYYSTTTTCKRCRSTSQVFSECPNVTQSGANVLEATMGPLLGAWLKLVAHARLRRYAKCSRGAGCLEGSTGRGFIRGPMPCASNFHMSARSC